MGQVCPPARRDGPEVRQAFGGRFRTSQGNEKKPAVARTHPAAHRVDRSGQGGTNPMASVRSKRTVVRLLNGFCCHRGSAGLDAGGRAEGPGCGTTRPIPQIPRGQSRCPPPPRPGPGQGKPHSRPAAARAGLTAAPCALRPGEARQARARGATRLGERAPAAPDRPFPDADRFPGGRPAEQRPAEQPPAEPGRARDRRATARCSDPRTRSRPDQERTKLDGSGRTGRAAATQVGAMTRIRPVPRAAICSQRATAGTAVGGGTGRPAWSRMTAPAAASACRDTR